MSVKERIKFVRANYANQHTLPVLYDWQQKELEKLLRSIPKKDKEKQQTARREFIEKHHELRLVVGRLSPQERTEADVYAAKAVEVSKGGDITYYSAYQEFIWPKIREKIQKGLERGEDGTFTELEPETLIEYLDAIQEYSDAQIKFIIRAYSEAEKDAKEQAEADPNFTAKAL